MRIGIRGGGVDSGIEPVIRKLNSGERVFADRDALKIEHKSRRGDQMPFFVQLGVGSERDGARE